MSDARDPRAMALATLVHELRQPLFVVKATAQLGRGAGPDDARFAQILEQVGHIEALLQHYGDAVVERGPLQRCALHPLIRQVAGELEPRLVAAGVRLDLSLAGGDGGVAMRPLAARQLLHNLLLNAVDAVEGLHDPRVEVRTEALEGALLLSVRDSGPGLGGLSEAELFAPFATSKSTGTGLGLHIAHQLVSDAGGSVSLSSEEHGGALAEVRLPLADAPDQKR
ncbi:MAG: hypothetical protein JXX28_08945 [Deltaproteobacteria bacterium]|nr:hypothetical protein [Deltaproteobacteria bacterium]